MHQTEQEINDEVAILKSCQRNPEAFGLIYEKYYKQIFLFIERRISDQATSGDLTSQVFLKAMLSLEKYKFKGVPFSAYLYRIASNQINEFYRKSKHQRVISLEDYHVSNLFEDMESGNGDGRTEILVELLNELDDAEVQLLELRFFEQRAFKEVAYILDITENNAKVKTYRILDKLKKIAVSKNLSGNF
jgi:RNA polymerase sigma-70 factor (ECF subfamily)